MARESGPKDLHGEVVVLSPHLDDGVMSLGAAISKATRSAARVAVVTVMAGDPNSRRPITSWDRRSGFSSEADAAMARREEDRRACELVGAEPVWIPFAYGEGGGGTSDEKLWSTLAPILSRSDVVLTPGSALTHPDHAQLTRLVLERMSLETTVGLYLEQPYAVLTKRLWLWPWRPSFPSLVRRMTPISPTWTILAARPRDRRAKRRAVREYKSQLPMFGLRPSVASRIALYEAARGGESVAWLTARLQSQGKPQLPGSVP